MTETGTAWPQRAPRGSIGPQSGAESTELDKMSNFHRRVKEIVKQWKRSDDMAERASHLLSEFESFGSVRFRVARAISICRGGLEHGGWLPLVRAVAVLLGVDERTVLRWVALYEKGTPALNLDQPPKDRGTDPEAAKRLEIQRSSHQGLAAGLTQEEAAKQAEEQAHFHEPPPVTHEPITPMIGWVRESGDAILKGLAYVPDDQKLEVFRIAAGQVLRRYTKEPLPITSVGHQEYRKQKNLQEQTYESHSGRPNSRTRPRSHGTLLCCDGRRL